MVRQHLDLLHVRKRPDECAKLRERRFVRVDARNEHILERLALRNPRIDARVVLHIPDCPRLDSIVTAPRGRQLHAIRLEINRAERREEVLQLAVLDDRIDNRRPQRIGGEKERDIISARPLHNTVDEPARGVLMGHRITIAELEFRHARRQDVIRDETVDEASAAVAPCPRERRGGTGRALGNPAFVPLEGAVEELVVSADADNAALHASDGRRPVPSEIGIVARASRLPEATMFDSKRQRRKCAEPIG